MKRLRPLLAVLIAAATVACRRESPPEPDSVARLGSEVVRYSRFESFLQENLGDNGVSLPSEVMSGLLDQFVSEELVRRLAVDRGAVAADAPPRAALEALLRGQPDEPSESEVAAYYQAHAADFDRPERVHLHQILTTDRGAAERAQAALAAGEPFADVARRWSREPGAARGGDQGELSRDDLPATLADTIFRLPPGQPSDIVAAEYGFHIFLVEGRHPAERAPLADVAGEIRALLRGQREDAHQAALVAEARSRYNPVIYGRNLPFSYQGQYPVVAGRPRAAA